MQFSRSFLLPKWTPGGAFLPPFSNTEEFIRVNVCGWKLGGVRRIRGTHRTACTWRHALIKPPNLGWQPPILPLLTPGIRKSWKNPKLFLLFTNKYVIDANWLPHQNYQVLSRYWDDRQMKIHPVNLGLLSGACTWHWLWGWWKVHGSESSAFTLCYQLRVSRTSVTLGSRELRFQSKRGSRRYFPAAVHYYCEKFVLNSLQL